MSRKSGEHESHTPSTSSEAETLVNSRSYDETTPPGVRSAGAVLSEQPGAVIGRYKLLQQIGEGGFGMVFLAEQREPVQRNVALKIIKLGMDTRDVIARFEQERQALAMMDHPNIAKVLDAGATATGRPYFVMELVKGIPITDYCDQQNMSFRDRLALFMQVCSAVQHAHQKGIIHRDIKPSNVLVTHVDDRPVPKVIDFGIAKATQQKLTDRTMFTQFGQFMGTPAYMSPEQADPLGLDIDTRSDIYSLGVLLYELLTGATPFEAKTLQASAIEEIKRIIRDQDPPRPSTRLSTLGNDLPNVAKRRGLEPKKFGTILRGDLDWIIMKALEKDRTMRYESATDFARDIERYLNQEPVAAGPPSASYRMRKFVRRHRTGVTSGVLVVLTLIAFAITMAIQARRIATERDRANREREMSDRVVEFQGKMLERIKPQKLGESLASDLHSRIGEALTADGVAEDERVAALASFDGALEKISLTDAARSILDTNILEPAVKAVEKEFANQPLVEARLQYVLANVYSHLGLPAKALPCSERAIELQRKELGEDHRDTIRSRIRNAMVLWDQSRSVESSDKLRETIAGAERELGPEDPDTLLAKLCLLVAEADVHPSADQLERYEALLKTQERVLGPNHEDLIGTLNNYATVLINLHHDDRAAPLLERSVKIDEEQFGPDTHHTLFAHQELAQAYQSLGRTDDAIKMQTEALQQLEKSLGSRHPDTIHAMSNLAQLYQSAGRYMEAEPFARKSLERCEAVLGPTHRSTMESLTNLGIVLGLLGRHQEAEPYFINAYERSKAVRGADATDTLNDRNNLAVHYWYLGQYQKALDLFTENLAAMERRYGKNHVETTHAMGNLGIILTKLGRLDEAQAMLERALEIRVKTYGADHRMTLETRGSLAQLAFERHEFQKAAQMYTDLVAAEKKAFGPEHSYTLESQYNLALTVEKLDRKEEAAKLLAEALELRRKNMGADHSETLDTATELARIQFDLGQTEEARKHFVEIIKQRRAAASSDSASAAQLNSCVPLLLKCPIEELRAPAEALKYAERANEATGYSDAIYLDNLAQALFDTGNAAKAIDIQQKALSVLPEASPSRAEFAERLKQYSAGSAEAANGLVKQ